MKLLKEIKTKKGEIVFRRYQLFSTPWFHCYWHEWYKADGDRHLHTHPWYFFGIILKGGYIEQTPEGLKKRGPFSIIKGKPSYIHKVAKLLKPSGRTLFFVGRKTYPWGFLVDGKIIPNEEYRLLKFEDKL
jgi:hypothetical protein